MTAQSARSRSAILGPRPTRISLFAQSSTETFWCWHRSEIQRLWPCLGMRHFVNPIIHASSHWSGRIITPRAVDIPSRVAQKSGWRGRYMLWLEANLRLGRRVDGQLMRCYGSSGYGGSTRLRFFAATQEYTRFLNDLSPPHDHAG